jgi:thioesterase domain-containing protein
MLPEYMIPSAWVFLPELPLTANGKIDRRALPAPEGVRGELGVEYVAPRTPTEVTLAAIWCALLRVDRVGIHDNFFALGGHSMLAIQVAARIALELGTEPALASIFEAKTLAELAEKVWSDPGSQDENPCRITTFFDAPASYDVYGFPGLGMPVVSYLELARALRKAGRLRMMEPVECRPRFVGKRDMLELATLYADRILAEGSVGRVRLLGHSYGGAVAFEVARVLEGRGFEVQIVLLDVPLIHPDHLLAMVDAEGNRRESTVLASEDSEMDGQRQLSTGDGGAAAREVEERILKESLAAAAAVEDMYRAYRPKGRFAGRVDYFLAREITHGRDLGPSLGFVFSCFFERTPTVHSANGGHLTMLLGENVTGLAEAIDEVLR